MIILGIDPGTKRIGYGLIRKERHAVRCLEAGILPIKGRTDLEALQETKSLMDALIKKWRPNLLAVEKLYFGKNQKTAIAVAQARGVIILAGLERGIEVRECTPTEVKAGLTGYGLSDKKALLKMVRLILKKPALNIIDDASDALALALFAANEKRITDLDKSK